MNIKVNDESMEIEQGTTIGILIKNRGITEGGTAVAVNNRIVRRASWNGHELREGDSVVIIKAAYGG